MIKLKKTSKLYQICLHFSKEGPQNLLELLSQLFVVPLSIVNWIIFSYIFFTSNPLYKINSATQQIELLHNPDLSNQFIAYIFLSFGWIVIPFLKMIYKHKINQTESFFMMFASLGLYSIFFPNVIVFGFLIFVLLFKNAGLNDKLANVLKNEKVQRVIQKINPGID